MTAISGGAAPRVSVMMAAYNGGNLIRESINSVLAQSFTDFEMIIIDDCSTDDTPEVLRSYTDQRLRILRNEVNLGVVGTRNRGLEEAHGDYIAILDQDDVSRPNRLAAQVAYLDSHPGTVLIASDAEWLEDGKLRPTGR